MPNSDIDSIDAVNSLLELIEAHNDDEIEILPNSDIEDQILYIASLPEAKGLIGYDAWQHRLYKILGLN